MQCITYSIQYLYFLVLFNGNIRTQLGTNKVVKAENRVSTSDTGNKESSQFHVAQQSS